MLSFEHFFKCTIRIYIRPWKYFSVAMNEVILQHFFSKIKMSIYVCCKGVVWVVCPLCLFVRMCELKQVLVKNSFIVKGQ